MGRPKLYTDEQLKERKRQYYLANKEKTVAYNTERTRQIVERRRDMLSQYCCRACGLNDPDVIQWHHVNPLEKKFEIFAGARAEETFWDEVLKCIPLCANCHIKVHQNKLCLINPTGFRQQQDIASICVRDFISPP